MAGLFSSGEQDMLGNIVQQRQQANQALGSQYGKYGGIVQAGAGMADIQADAMYGGKTGASDPRMQQMNEVKNIFAQVAMEVGSTTSAAFYNKLSQALASKFPEQAQKAADKAKEMEGKEFETANRTRNVYRIIKTKDQYGINDIEKQVMVTQEWRNGKWVDMGEAVDDTNYSNEGRNAPPPKTEDKKESRGTVEIGPAIQSEIAKTIPLGPLRPKEQGGGGLMGAEPEGVSPTDEKPMQFPKQSELKAAHNKQKMLLAELQKLRKSGMNTAGVERQIRENKDKITTMESRLGNK